MRFLDAITLAVSILISAVVSLTLTPMMCARMLPPPDPHAHGQPGFLDAVIARYGRWLDWVLQHQALTLGVTIGTVLVTAGLYIIVPKGFFPLQDVAAIQAVTDAPQSVSFAAMAERQQALAAKILEDPAVRSLSSFIGVDGTNSTLNSGRMLINLHPHGDRSESAMQIIERLKVAARDVPGISLYLQPVQELTIEDRVSRTQFQFTLTCPDEKLLQEWVPQLITALQDVPQLSDVASDLQNRGLQAFLEIDRDAASRLGVTVSDIDDALYSAFGQRQISTLFTQASQYRVVMEIDPRLASGPEALTSLFVRTRSGQPVPLSSIARVSERPTTLLINHVGQFPSVSVSFNLGDKASLGDAVAASRHVVLLLAAADVTLIQVKAPPLSAALRSGSAPPELSAGAMELLAAQTWRGNIRELRNVLEQAAMRSDSQHIEIEHLEEVLRESGVQKISPASIAQPAAVQPAGHALRPMWEQVEQLERQAVRAAMESTGGNKVAAEVAGHAHIRAFLQQRTEAVANHDLARRSPKLSAKERQRIEENEPARPLVGRQLGAAVRDQLFRGGRGARFERHEGLDDRAVEVGVDLERPFDGRRAGCEGDVGARPGDGLDAERQPRAAGGHFGR